MGRTTKAADSAGVRPFLISASTLDLVEGYVSVKALGPRNVKGLQEPIEVYELCGAGTARTDQAEANRVT